VPIEIVSAAYFASARTTLITDALQNDDRPPDIGKPEVERPRRKQLAPEQTDIRLAPCRPSR